MSSDDRGKTNDIQEEHSNHPLGHKRQRLLEPEPEQPSNLESTRTTMADAGQSNKRLKTADAGDVAPAAGNGAPVPAAAAKRIKELEEENKKLKAEKEELEADIESTVNFITRNLGIDRFSEEDIQDDCYKELFEKLALIAKLEDKIRSLEKGLEEKTRAELEHVKQVMIPLLQEMVAAKDKEIANQKAANREESKENEELKQEIENLRKALETKEAENQGRNPSNKPNSERPKPISKGGKTLSSV